MRLAVLIPAAGASARMQGQDKLGLTLSGVPLLRRQVMRALALNAPVVVTIPDPDHPRAAQLADLPVQLVPVPDARDGMAASLKRGVAALPECDAFLMLLPDLPLLTTEDLQTVIAAHDAAHLIWRGTTEDSKPGHTVLFDARLRPEFARLTGDTGGAPVIAAHADQTRFVPLPGDAARFDLDTPEAWAAFRQTKRGAP